MKKIVPLTQENAAYIKEAVSENHPDQVLFIDAHIANIEIYSQLDGARYVVMDLEVNGGTVYPVAVISDDYLEMHPNRFAVSETF